MPPPPPHSYRYPPHGHGAYPQPYYSPYPYCGPPAPVGPVAPVGPQYQDPCYPASYYHRAMHYRRHYSYLTPGPQDPYSGGASALAVPGVPPGVPPPAGAVHQMQMVVSSGPPPVPGAPPTPLDYPVESYGHYPTYPGPETATFRCPCPMQSCPKNVHTGPLTGDGKGPKQMQPLALPLPLALPPVALALPQEPPTLPPGILGPPSPARGSAGMPPPPSPAAGATHAHATWDNMEGSKSVVKQDPGTPPEAPVPTEPPALVLATRHNLCRQNVPPPANPPTTCANLPAHLTPRRKRAASPVLGDAVKVEDAKDAKELVVAKAAQNDFRDLKDIKDVKSVSVMSFTTTITTTTIEESTQTTPPPESRLSAPEENSRQAVDKRPGGQEAGSPPSKKKKSKIVNALPTAKALLQLEVSKSKSNKSKCKKVVEVSLSEGLRPGLGQGLTTTVAALTTPPGPPKPANKNSRKTSSTTSTTVTTAVTTASTSCGTTSTTSSGKKSGGGKKAASKRTSSVDSNKFAGSSGGRKRSKSQDKSDEKPQDKAGSKASSRDNSSGPGPGRRRSRSASRSRLAEEEEAAAAVVAAAGLPEGVPLNQCRRLIAAQKKLISKCQAKKEREQARLARQEAARAARLAALVSAAEARKQAAAAGQGEAGSGTGTGTGTEVAHPVGDDVAARLSPAVPGPAPAPGPAAHHHGKHHHNNNNLVDPAVDRSRVEELGRLAGLEVPASLTISQSELRLLESCAEPKTPKWSNGWQWRGQPFLHRVFLNCDDPPVLRKCYPAMQHEEGDNITLGDTILLKSGTRKIDLPFVARVIHLWENPEDGEMMLSLVWFYRPEHTEQGRRPCDRDDEIFSSRHKDFNSVACIEDKCYVLTFNEYCRYRKTIRRLEEGLSPPSLIVPGPEGKYPRHHRLPPGHVAPDMVFFCRRIYDFRQRRLQKNVC